MPRTEKLERVAELKQRIEGSAALLLTEYRGLTVSEITALRRSLRDADASFAVVKNTLMARAAADAGMELADLLTGPSAVAFVSGDAVTAAKQIKAATKLYPTLVLKGGFMDGQVLSAEDANRLADLETREVMLSKIAGLLKGEMSRAASTLQAAQSRFLSLLEAYREKVPGDAESADATEEPAREETSSSEAEEAAPAEASSEGTDEGPDDGSEDAPASGGEDVEEGKG